MKELLSYLCTMSPRVAQLVGEAATAVTAEGSAAAGAAATASAPSPSGDSVAQPTATLANTLADGGSIDLLLPRATPAAGESQLQPASVAGTAAELRCFIDRLCCYEPELVGQVRFFAAGVTLHFDSVASVNTVLRFTGRRGTACFKAAVLNGFVPVRAAAILEPTLYKGEFLATNVCASAPENCRCYSCSAILPCSVAAAMVQSLHGGDYDEGAEDGALYCGQCQERMYLSGLCHGSPRSDHGKGHNHCTECPDFGQCIGDIRNDHCRKCGDHYFAGSMGSFPCQNCGDGTEADYDDYDYFPGRQDEILSDEEAVRGDDPTTLHPFEVAADAVTWNGCLTGATEAIIENLTQNVTQPPSVAARIMMLHKASADARDGVEAAGTGAQPDEEVGNTPALAADGGNDPRANSQDAAGGSSTGAQGQQSEVAHGFAKLTVAQLRERLKRASLDPSGRKAELVERLAQHAQSSTVGTANSQDAAGGSSTDAQGQQSEVAHGFAKLTVAQLRERLKRASLDPSGRKAELVERLAQHARSSGGKGPDTTDGIGTAEWSESLEEGQPKAKRARKSP
jgi:hypothetical protein